MGPTPAKTTLSTSGSRTSALAVTTAVVVALICGGLAWLTPRPQGDLFLALAGGQDVLEGRLGSPDEWSFANGDQVWIHQNWLADMVIYSAHQAGGEAGLLILKALLVAGIMAAVVLAARERGAGLAAGLLAAGAAVMAWPQAMLLRANLFSLILAPLMLWLLYLSRRRPGFIWPAAALAVLWANTHGAFIFGLALLGLWAITHLVVLFLGRGSPGAGRRAGLFAAAAGAAVIGSGLINPFGLRTLQVPFLLRSSEVWKGLTEWNPLFSDSLLRARTPWLFLGLIAVLVVGAGFNRWRAGRLKTSAPKLPGDENRLPVLLFEVALAGVLIVMAFQAQRFVLFASVVLAPLIAIQLEALLGPRRRMIPVLAAAALILVAAIWPSTWVFSHYRADNPARPSESLFARMVYQGTHFPVGAASFLNENKIGGPAFNEWRWEGFLRLHAPQLPLFAGGRAHQAYSEQTVIEYYEILDDPQAATRLKARGVDLAVVPLDVDLGPFCLNLLQSPDSPWAYIYCDQTSAVFAAIDGPNTRELVSRAMAGDLIYPDEPTAALSRAMCLASPALGTPPREGMDALLAAMALRPTRFAYPPFYSQAVAAGVDKNELIGHLEAEAERLEKLATDGPGGANVLVCRMTVAQVLDSLYDPTQQQTQRLAAQHRSRIANDELQEIVRKYRFTTRIR